MIDRWLCGPRRPLWHLALYFLSGWAVAGEPAPVVQVEGGRISGGVLDVGGTAVQVFRGIPFAAPPLGDLRWRPPQPVKPWDTVRECLQFAPACPQPADLTYGFSFQNQSEDCLYLNVWTAAKDPAERRPVMVWIHGGGNTIGGASAPFYDGRHFAAAGVVLVSIQYRLGAFGYLAHPALSAEAKSLDGREASGNYGLLDQIAALRWVQTNIGRFGGDKDRVTIFGESAGAANVTHLMASPLAQGLFHRRSPSPATSARTRRSSARGAGPRNVSAHQNGIEFAQRLGVTGEDGSALAALRQLPAEKLLSVPVAIGTVVGGGTGGRAFRFGPVVDGYVLPRAPGEVWAAGQMHRVPLMAGSLLDDGSVFSRANPVQRLFGYRLVMRTIFGPDADRAMELFPAAGDDQVPAAMHRVITVTSFRAPARRLVRWMEAAGGDAWLYHFSRNPGQGRAVRDGVFHGLEIGYVFNTLTAWGDATDKTLGQDMLRRWVNFRGTETPTEHPAARRRRIPPGPSTARPRINTWNSAIRFASRRAWTAKHATWPTAPPHAETATVPHASRKQGQRSGGRENAVLAEGHIHTSGQSTSRMAVSQ